MAKPFDLVLALRDRVTSESMPQMLQTLRQEVRPKRRHENFKVEDGSSIKGYHIRTLYHSTGKLPKADSMETPKFYPILGLIRSRTEMNW